MLGGLLMVLVALSMAPPPAAPNAPSPARVGPYVVSVEAVEQSIDFSRPGEAQRTTGITVAVEGPPEDLARLLEVAQEPAAWEGAGKPLEFQQIRYPTTSTVADNAGAIKKVRLQIWFSSPTRPCIAVGRFSSALVCYKKKENIRLDFLSVADEQLRGQYYKGLMIQPSAEMRHQAGQRSYEVALHIVCMEEDDNLPDSQWVNEQVQLIDAEGKVISPLSTSRTYQYDDRGQVSSRSIIARFGEPRQAPRGVRYRAERLSGIETFPYSFEGVPLP